MKTIPRHILHVGLNLHRYEKATISSVCDVSLALPVELHQITNQLFGDHSSQSQLLLIFELRQVDWLHVELRSLFLPAHLAMAGASTPVRRITDCFFQMLTSLKTPSVATVRKMVNKPQTPLRTVSLCDRRSVELYTSVNRYGSETVSRSCVSCISKRLLKRMQTKASAYYVCTGHICVTNATISQFI